MQKYNELLDFQIAGNGIGGIGRVEKKYISDKLDENEEMKNQTFLIQIIPKIGKIDSELSNSPQIKNNFEDNILFDCNKYFN